MRPPVPQGKDREVTDFLASLLDVELKQVDEFDPADLPRVFLTDVENPEGVQCVQALNKSNGTPASTLVSWRRSSDSEEPGVEVTAMGGLSSGVTYSVVLRIEGSRRRARVFTGAIDGEELR